MQSYSNFLGTSPSTYVMEHCELMKEMPLIEQLSTQDRLMLAKKLRLQQLKQWQQFEKDWQKKSNKSVNIFRANCTPKTKQVSFNNSVVLLEAAARNDIGEVKQLLQKGINPNSTNEDGLTALHQCCIDNNESMLQLLIEFGANVNATDSEKWTPLHAAATCGHQKLIKRLISNGAHLLAVNADGNMPYDICEDESSLDFIESEMAKRGVTQELIDETRGATEMQMLNDLQKLVDSDTDLNDVRYNGASLLHIASANGYLSVVEFLLNHNVKIDIADSDDWKPIHAAACWGHMNILELLVHHGADLNSRNKHDETPAEICEDPKLHQRIVQLQNEQELKRQQAEKKRSSALIKRSYSNSRSQSVRRMSIRDKSLTTKKDAVEETRLRLEAQELSESGERRDPDGQDCSKESLAVDDQSKPHAVLQENFELENPSKINVTVFVTINGTLAELKKQRSQTRKKNSVNTNDVFEKSDVINSNANNSNVGCSHVNRFSGTAVSDAIDDIAPKKCCSIQ